MTKIVYNGYTLDDADSSGASNKAQYVKISEFSSVPVLGDDGQSHETTRHRISGTAVIHRSSQANFAESLTTARGSLTRFAKSLVVSTTGGSTIADLDGTTKAKKDDIGGGPVGEFSITEIKGQLAAIVTFTIEWHKFEYGSASAVSDIMSHVWEQEFTIGEEGRQTWTVTGILKVRAAADATTAAGIYGPTGGTTETYSVYQGDAPIGNDPDAYRRLVMPILPTNFRWKSMTFTMSMNQTEMRYVFIAEECAGGLPSIAWSGNGDYTFTKALGGDMLGTKKFSVTLAGDLSTTNAELLSAALQISQNRIKWTGVGKDLVNAVSVTELDFLTSNKIKFDVSARVVSGDNGPNVFGSFANNVRLGGITTGLAAYQTKNPYGAALIRSVRRAALFDPTANGGSQVPDQARTVGGLEEITAIDVASETSGVQNALLTPDGGQGINDQFSDETQTFPYVKVEASDRLIVEDTGLRVMQANGLNADDKVFQVRRPRVFIETTITAARLGKAPDRLMRPSPANAAVMMDDFDPHVGKYDANGYHIYVGRHVRRVQLRKVGNDRGFRTVNEQFMQFWPPNKSIAMPVDPRITMNKTSDLLTPADKYAFPVGNPETYVS